MSPTPRKNDGVSNSWKGWHSQDISGSIKVMFEPTNQGLMVYTAGGAPGTLRMTSASSTTRAPHVDAGPLPAHAAVQLRTLRSVGAQGADHLRWFLNINKTFKTIEHGSLNVPIEHHPTIRYMVYNGYYKVMSNIPKMGHLPTPVENMIYITTKTQQNTN